MADDLTGVIHDAMADAGDNLPTDLPDPVVDATDDAPVEAATDAVVDPDLDETGKELFEAGIKPPKEGERENRIPYNRVTKIVENAKKKLREQQAKDLKERDDRLAGYATKEENWAKWDQLIQSDAPRAVHMLAAMYPDQWRGYVAQKKEEAKQEAKVTKSELGERPTPDYQFPDGSPGYTPAQFDKLQDWNRGKAKEEAKTELREEFEARYGPIEQSFKASQAEAKLADGIHSDLQEMRDTWGELFAAEEKLGNDSEILKLMATDKKLTLKKATQRILMNRLTANRTKVRAEVLAEMQARPAAVAGAPGKTKAVEESSGPQSTEDIIRNAMRSANLK